MKLQLTSLIALTLVSACGAGGGSSSKGDSTPAADPSTTGTGSNSSLMLSDQNAASQVVASHVDVAIGAVAEENTAGTTGAFLAGVDRSSEMHRFRQCTVDGNKAVVNINQSVVRDFSLDALHRSYENKFENYREKTRTWSRDTGAVVCDAAGKYAKIDVATMAGVTLDVTVKDTRARSISLTNKKTGAATTEASKFELDGTRHVSWKTVTTNGTNYELTKESTHAITSTLSVQKKDGTMTTLTSSVKNLDSAPFEIVVERDKTTLNLVSRTIKSGTLESIDKDGNRVDTVFKGVVYSENADDKCLATAGEIDGSIYAKDATTAGLTFVIAFGDTPTITFSNGTSASYDQEGCELDDPSATATEAATKASVTAPAAVAPAAS